MLHASFRTRSRGPAAELTHGAPDAAVQDYPGRTKLWHVGVPPSGPMDALAFRLANALVGNAEDAAGLEITLSGDVGRAASQCAL